MRFSRAQQGKLDLGTARAEDKAATSTALYNIGIQDAADKAIYKIFGENYGNRKNLGSEHDGT